MTVINHWADYAATKRPQFFPNRIYTLSHCSQCSCSVDFFFFFFKKPLWTLLETIKCHCYTRRSRAWIMGKQYKWCSGRAEWKTWWQRAVITADVFHKVLPTVDTVVLSVTLSACPFITVVHETEMAAWLTEEKKKQLNSASKHFRDWS